MIWAGIHSKQLELVQMRSDATIVSSEPNQCSSSLATELLQRTGTLVSEFSIIDDYQSTGK